MAEKGIYKKANGPGWDYDPDNKRAKENKFFEQAARDNVANKKKVKPKSKERSTHKHEYLPCVIWSKTWGKEKMDFHEGNVCTTCGRTDSSTNFYGLLSSYGFLSGREEKEKAYLGELPHFERVEGKDNLVKIEKEKYAQKIFLGGSKVLTELTLPMRNLLVKYMHANATFLIGDIMEADLLMQKFLSKHGYKKVIVYTIGEKSRVNIGFWEEKKIVALGLKGYDAQAQKDIAMVNEADEGIMFFKGKTRGTIANVERLIGQGKSCKVAFPRKKRGNISFSEVSTVENERALAFLKRELEELEVKS